MGTTDRRARRTAVWALVSGLAVAVVGGGVASLLAFAWSRADGAASDLVPVWGSWGWWLAALAYLGALLVPGVLPRPTVRRAALSALAAFLLYEAVGSTLTTIDYAGTAMWADAAEWSLFTSVFSTGNGWVALLAAPALALLPPFRPAVLGEPALWSNHLFTPADDDAAAEDFGIW